MKLPKPLTELIDLHLEFVTHEECEGIGVYHFDIPLSRMPRHTGGWQWPLIKHYPNPVRDAGGALIDLPGKESEAGEPIHRYRLVYPASHDYFRGMFTELGFGKDGFRSVFTGRHPNDEENLPERILNRRRQALEIYDQMQSEEPLIPEMILDTSATLCTVANLPPRPWADHWGRKVWEFYVENYAREHGVAVDRTHDFTKSECMRLARKHGAFKFGGYG